MAAYTQDDGFHEIQLNGKQLVFLFMAATVVSVVIFLCGVLVGRGVRAERGDLVQAPPAELSPVPSASVTGEPAPQGPEPGAPPTPVDELSYFNRLEKQAPTVETLTKPEALTNPDNLAKPDTLMERASPPPAPPSATRADAPPRPATPSAAPAQPAAVPPARLTASRDVPPPSAEAAPGPGYAVQVAALNVRSEADAMAKRLSSKGYAAYVLAPASGTPAVFRVRIGTFKTRREAEAMASRLQKEEQFKPWVTR